VIDVLSGPTKIPYENPVVKNPRGGKILRSCVSDCADFAPNFSINPMHLGKVGHGVHSIFFYGRYCTIAAMYKMS